MGLDYFWATNIGRSPFIISVTIFATIEVEKKRFSEASALDYIEQEKKLKQATMASSLSRRSHRYLRQTLFLSRGLHEGPDTIDELLDRHLVKKDPKKDSDGDDDDDGSLRRSLTSTRREALSLYRDVLRTSRFFTWPDARGVPWREALRENARKEFEEARFETDPEVVTRLLIGGREAVQEAVDKLAAAAKKMADQEANERNKGRR